MGTHEDLIAAAIAGDRIALATFVRATQTDVWRYCAYRGHGHDTDDLVQDTYLRALRSLHRYHGPAPAKAWLLAIARNVCADTTRGARRRRVLDALLARDRQPQNDAVIDLDLADLVQRLPGERREAFVLTQVLDNSYAAAAEILGIPVGTVRSRVARARQDLQRQLDQATG